MQQKTKIIIVASIVSIGIIIIATLAVLRKTNHQDNTTQRQERGQLQKQAEKITADSEVELQEKVSAIVEEGNLSRCEGVVDETYRKICINTVAINLAKKTGDMAYCQKVDGELVAQDACTKESILSASLEKEDVSLCEGLEAPSEKDACRKTFYAVVPGKRNDSNLCVGAPDEAYCRDTVLFRAEYGKNGLPYECTKFQSPQVKEDCVIFQDRKNASRHAATVTAEGKPLCAGVKSELFLQLCRRPFLSTNPQQ